MSDGPREDEPLLSIEELTKSCSDIFLLFRDLLRTAREDHLSNPTDESLIEEYAKMAKMAYSYKVMIETCGKLGQEVVLLRKIVEKYTGLSMNENPGVGKN